MDNIIISLKSNYKKEASKLGAYQKMSFNELANGYCDAIDNNNKSLQDSYFSAMMLRLLPNVYNFYRKWNGIYSIEDVHDKAVDAIIYQCQPKYRAWRRPDSKLNAQQCLTQTLSCRFAELSYTSNLDLHKANYNTISFDTPINEDDDKRTLGDVMTKESTFDELKDIYSGTRSLIQTYINEGKPVEGIILDTIAYNDTTRQTKKVEKKVDEQGKTIKSSSYSTEFWEFKAIQYLNDLPKDYANIFKSKYQISDEILQIALTTIQKATNQKLYKYLRATLADCKSNPQKFALLYN